MAYKQRKLISRSSGDGWPKLRNQQIWSLVRNSFLVHRQLSFHGNLTQWKGQGNSPTSHILIHTSPDSQTKKKITQHHLTVIPWKFFLHGKVSSVCMDAGIDKNGTEFQGTQGTVRLNQVLIENCSCGVPIVAQR